MNVEMPVGVSDFKKLRTKYYFIDKTDFIRQFIDGHKDVTLFTRPRRFGKTLTLSMLDYFFSIDKKSESESLFSNLAIDQAGQRYMKERGTYPVIFMTLKNFHNTSWDSMYRSIRLIMQKVYAQYMYLLNGDVLTPFEKEFMHRMLYLEGDLEEYQYSLQWLTGALYKYHHVAPFIFIDEYDAPLQNAYEFHFYDKAIPFWKGWFNAALKDNEMLNAAILTGVLRIAKESIFSGLNNLSVYSTLTDTYSTLFGFTTQEIQLMAQDLGHTDKLDELRHWYDGYTFGHSEIYNPWSVICYFDAHCKPAPYWVNTSNNSILQILLHQANASRIQALQELMDGKSIRTLIDEGVLYSDISHSDTALYSMLLNTGYLKAIHQEHTASGIELYDVMIPNEEIKRVYKREILDNIATDLPINLLMDFQTALLRGDGKVVHEKLSEILLKMVSFYDTRSTESFYHGLLLGMTCLLEGSLYHVVSNRESGYGRFDLAIFPVSPRNPGVIMEFKVAKAESELVIKAKEALQQITTKKYITEFQKQGVQTIWQYGIAFCGKDVTVIQDA